MKMFRQGDVLIEQVKEIPKRKAEVVPREGGRVILAHGEVTGHAHALVDQTAVLMSLAPPPAPAGVVRGGPVEPERYLKLERQSTLSHEEHGPIELPAGTYRITIQRQWDQSQGWVNVAD